MAAVMGCNRIKVVRRGCLVSGARTVEYGCTTQSSRSPQCWRGQGARKARWRRDRAVAWLIVKDRQQC